MISYLYEAKSWNEQEVFLHLDLHLNISSDHFYKKYIFG